MFADESPNSVLYFQFKENNFFSSMIEKIENSFNLS